ncbi:MAG TPA: metal-sensitive transcriptional regulator [Anaerolineaceae bacterium]|jgi:DNA-binding FrmR family transcriptional regulator|nr:metal-sensitive transcriptional regulator [Chloroflexota bacterium]HNS07537.1 metal-sensitive transcriptional regulator [Anaerolineaceae bacterium]HNW13633.1 metal-sensitive transcriptional regulator [Anaerolineaceae bacterium]HOE02037.1 metal-sensitive transcriptional regulator [Anaerolineaceae bacterium]HOQ69191.1 metal-sensitive transcriptional regulator [Anaerolineaceae bacterium]
MKVTSENGKKQVINRLNRLEGQIRGINRMLAQERDCSDILQQFVAARSALQAALDVYTGQIVNDCLLADDLSLEQHRKLAVEMLAVIRKT